MAAGAGGAADGEEDRKPVHEVSEAGRTNSKIGLNWSLPDLNNYVCQSYPKISLNLVGFELARAGKGRKIKKLQVCSVRELKAAVGKSRLYIVPRATVLQVTSPPPAMSQRTPPPSAMSQRTPPPSAMSQRTPPPSAMSQRTPPPSAMSFPPLAALTPPETSTRSLMTSTRSLMPVSSLQSPLSETSTRSLMTSTRSLMPVSSLQSPLSETSTRSLMTSTRSLMTSTRSLITSTRSLMSETSTSSLILETSTQPSVSVPSLQPEQPIIIHDEDEALGGPVDEPDLQSILRQMVATVDFTVSPTSNQINVCRDSVLLCSLRAFKRKFFNPHAKLDVVFVDEDDNGEGAVDEGGPTREYLRLLMRSVHQSNIFEGHEKDRRLSLDTQALQTKLYTWVGKMIAVCVVHGGVGPHFFSERLFHQICGIPTPLATVDEVGDHTFREQLIKIQEATTVQEARSAVAEAADSLSIIGALRYVSSLEEKNSLVQSAADFFVTGRMATALDQFAEGLKTLGVLEELRKNPTLFYNMFVSEEIPLQAKDLCTLFDVDFSVQGSNRRDRENSTICFWRDWLIEIEGGECSPVTLEKVLEFASGASAVPPLGFPERPLIQFLHEGNRVFPEANTCIVVLRLPLHSSYEAFEKHMTEGILQAPIFGLS
ncbi:G2/M phase-specific E3 ubiquitin-protein ligase-like [Sardina pilchardus]|uniref:G2/M phase-specific E3 ubiquitin-protein ligase-like n=1 Tax=Sardina pilchardus TaxID=27697 RepID=UPI002E11E49D